MIIKINKWEEYNRRTNDIKRPYWFSFNNRFFDDPFICELTDREKITFIYVLCETSQANKNGEVELSVTKFVRHTGFKSTELLYLLDKLLKSGRAADMRQNRGRIAAGILPAQDTTIHNITLGGVGGIAPPAGDAGLLGFDLQALYDAYPCKKGKAEGLARLRRIIKKQSDYDAFVDAVNNYVFMLKRDKTDPKYYKHFPSFIGTEKVQSWRDWIDVKPAYTPARFVTEEEMG